MTKSCDSWSELQKIPYSTHHTESLLILTIIVMFLKYFIRLSKVWAIAVPQQSAQDASWIPGNGYAVLNSGRYLVKNRRLTRRRNRYP